LRANAFTGFSMTIANAIPDTVARAIEGAFTTSLFVSVPPLTLQHTFEPDRTEIWELYRGQALDHRHTRETHRVAMWAIHDGAEKQFGEPLLALRWDAVRHQLHVTRGVLSRVWEAYTNESGGVTTRPVQRRVRELVATVPVRDDDRTVEIVASLARHIQQAVTGISRLPLTSIESPLPEFQSGHLYYNGPADSLGGFNTADERRARRLEFSLRSGVAEEAAPISRSEYFSDLSRMLNDTSLSPCTDWLDSMIKSVAEFKSDEPDAIADVVDFFSRQLRLLFRHLNAFDLVQFHQRGANYPDAILINGLLQGILKCAQEHPSVFLNECGDRPEDLQRKLRRRFGISAGWLLFERYRGHPVPDIPISIGENARIYRYSRVPEIPEEQMADPAARRRRLFEEDWRTRFQIDQVRRQCALDFNDPSTSIELGKALFLDRPFGVFKANGEPDRTPLLSYLAYSGSLAESWLAIASTALDAPRVKPVAFVGVSWNAVNPRFRPGAASLEDASLVADDFQFLELTSRSRKLLCSSFDWRQLQAYSDFDPASAGNLLIRSPDDPEVLLGYGSDARKRIAVRWRPGDGLTIRAGVELPASALCLTGRWRDDGSNETFSDCAIHVPLLRP